VNKYVESCN